MHRTPITVLSLGLALVLFGCGGTGAAVDSTKKEVAASLPSYRVVQPFTVLKHDGTSYAHPFLGGLNVPRPQFVDIDADGDPDLFVQEYTGAVMFFENVGRSTEPKFVWRSDKYKSLDVGEWYRFADIDRDGDFDLLAEQPYSYIRYYRNAGSETEPEFDLAADTLYDAEGEAIFSDRQNIPNVTDIDCDEASDLFIGRLDGTITRYEAVETSGAPIFELVTERFEDIEIVAQFGQPGNADPGPMPNIPSRDNMPGNGPSAPEAPSDDAGLHGANTMTFADIDSDGDMDLFWGDFFEPSLLRIENTGSCRAPSLREEPEPFPPPNPIRSSGYNAPAFTDIDGDDDMDLFVGVLGGAFNPNLTADANFYFYEQEGESSYRLRTRRFLDQVDVGSESYPTAADLDGDGDAELLVANKISSEDSRTSTLVRFDYSDGFYRKRDSLELLPSYHYAPAFADLDADGDLDLLLGTWNDGLALYRNAGSTRTPRFELEEEGFVTLSRGSHSTPALVDIDGDGDLDLFVGETSGTLNYYVNAGTPSEPRFELVSDEYLGIDVGRRSVPAFLDVDGDGDEDLIVGSESEGLVFFRNTGTPNEPDFSRVGPLAHDVPPMAVPVFGDFDGDGRLELIVGGLGGGLSYYDEPLP